MNWVTVLMTLSHWIYGSGIIENDIVDVLHLIKLVICCYIAHYQFPFVDIMSM